MQKERVCIIPQRAKPQNASQKSPTHGMSDKTNHLLLLPLAVHSLLHGLILRAEVQTDAVHTVPLIRGRGEPLALEDMAQVPAAVGAVDLDALHKQAVVLVALHGAGDAVEVGRPAAPAGELVRGLVQGRVAPGAGVDALGGVVLVESAGAGCLGALLAEDAELLWGGFVNG